MAKEVQSKKRKASVPEGDAEKMKKVKKVTAVVSADPVKKRKATEDAALVVVKKTKTPKPRLPDVPKMKHAKKDATSDKAAEKNNGDSETPKAPKPSKVVRGAAEELKSTNTKEDKVPKSADPVIDAEDDSVEEIDDEDEESEIDDQTEALLKGFESDGDEEDAEKDGGLKEGEEVPQIPKKSKKQLKKASDFAKDDKPGVVYVGRIPHGFYEHEMKEYFKQFGKILQLRLSRNKKTGASKHIAWIQFESATVADIVAKTMDNYLLFGHILKVKVIPNEQVPANLWKGANKRFKRVPWNKMEGRKLKEPKSEEQWDKQAENVRVKRHQKAEKLEAIGYKFESPKIKPAKGVAKKAEQPALITEEAEVKAIEPAPAAEDTTKKGKKDGKKEKKAQLSGPSKTTIDVDTAPVTDESNKLKKEKKRKVAKVEEAPVAAETTAPVEPIKKDSKSKKAQVEADETSEEKVKKPKKSKKIKDSA